MRLWLVQPPLEVRNEVPGFEKFAQASNQNTTPTVVVYGGAAEISQFVAQQIYEEAVLDPSQCLRIWEEGFSIGEQAVWCPVPSVWKRSAVQLAQSFYTKDLKETQATNLRFPTIPPLHQFRVLLLRKAYLVVHRVLERLRYEESPELNAFVGLALTAIAVGCIRSQFNDRTNGNAFQSFAWAFDVRHDQLSRYLGVLEYNDQCNMLLQSEDRGISSALLLALAGSIWGGASFELIKNSLHPDTVGLVCPHGTFLLDLVRNPEGYVEQVAQGMVGTLFSFFKGSVPLLPQSSSDRSIVGGTASASRSRVSIQRSSKLPHGGNSADYLGRPPIFTLETMSIGTSHISIVLCAWVHGDVLAELNPAAIFENLLEQWSTAQWTASPIIKERTDISCELLLKSKFFQTDKDSDLHVIFTEPQWEWRALIAGLAPKCNVVDTRYLSSELKKTINRSLAMGQAQKPYSPLHIHHESDLPCFVLVDKPR